MNRSITFIIMLFITTMAATAQEKSDVLLTLDGNPVYASEFKRVYQKNLELVQDERQKTVEGYLDLFIDYKLKVQEAYAQELDKKPGYIKEFEKYQEQLSRYYIYEDNATTDLAKEAYERGKEEIKASHILIKSSYADSPADTLKAYQKASKIRDRALNGENFEALAKETSEEPNADKTGGNLNYFSVFSLVYPFETVAYNTPVGSVSEIVRTRFGYHIIKVHDRRERAPQRTISHIMISDRADDARTFDPEERINNIYQLLQQGQTFEDLAKQYSEDTGSSTNGGMLRPFGKGEIKAKKFDSIAFGIEKVGEVTKPFKSMVGWHIVRLDKIHTISSFEEEKETMEKRVQNGARAKIVTAEVTNDIMKKYGFERGAPFLEYFKTYLNDDVLKRRWKYVPIPETDNTLLFTIGDRQVYRAQFAKYIGNMQRKTKRNFGSLGDAIVYWYNQFETETIKQYYKDRLEDEDPEYAGVITEYRDGLLIFDLMQTNVWNKAKKDTIGAQQFYEANKDQYKWGKRVDAVIVNTNEKSYAKKAKQLLGKGKSGDAIKSALNTDEAINVIISEGKFEEGAKELPKNFKMKMGVSETFQEESRYTIVKVLEVIPETTKEFDDVRGRVMTQYQQKLEEELMTELRSKYKIDVNKEILNKLKKELNN
ncbi:peptidylprolyl isomerase [Rasiella rasia]|uniref:Peptidylprolyl isomerase n=1 Tax=Rasiella rasia TaxID=2744027 RepID=A0A6G6GK35_9FLAO|nr:peptidylprolyl isomerase [Rasiella rasia]QIE58908.1 peptidylprolyl isomerase [Rasiella rasia]